MSSHSLSDSDNEEGGAQQEDVGEFRALSELGTGAPVEVSLVHWTPKKLVMHWKSGGVDGMNTGDGCWC